jgi:glycosyltransferase involved in cell wall biosynthesis
MKVLFTIDTLQQGGAEQSIANLIRNFSNNIDVTILYFYPKADLLSTYQELDCNIIAMNLTGKYQWFKAIKGMKKIIKHECPDIVVSSLYRSNIISRIACYITNTKLVGTFVDDSYNIERRKTFKGFSLIKYQSTWLLDRLTSFIPIHWISNSICIAKQNATKLGIAASKITTIYRGRDSNIFIQWRNEKENPFVFICVGRLYEKKGYPELISAFAKLSHTHNNIKLHIYGEGTYRTEMENQIEALQMNNKIILFGNVNEAWKKIYESNCFVFPSRFEGFSGALVEAMMTGIPIISSNIPMNVEAVENNKTALVHQVKNSDDLYVKMNEMIAHFSSMIEMGKCAREISIQKFDIKNIANQYESLLYSLAK